MRYGHRSVLAMVAAWIFIGVMGCAPSQPIGLSVKFDTPVGPITVERIGFRGTAAGVIVLCDYRAIYENTTSAPQQPKAIVTLLTREGNSLTEAPFIVPMTLPGRKGLVAIAVPATGCQHAQQLHLRMM